MVMAQSLFISLKARLPGSFLAVIAPAWTEPLLARMPEVDLSVPAAFSHGKLGLAERRAQARKLRELAFDQAIVLPRSIKSALAPWMARIPRRTGFRGEMRYGLINDMRVLDKTALPLTVERFVSLGSEQAITRVTEYPKPALRVDQSAIEVALDDLGLDRERPIVALCPGAEYGGAKRWPVRHFATLAQQLAENGYQVWLFGSQKDAALSAKIQDLCGGVCTDLCGRTRLGEAIDLMSLACAAVSNDSGLMHVAAGLGVPLVALYGSSSPQFTPPLADDATVLNLKLECSPCFKRECPLGHLNCLEQLQPEQVFKALLLPGRRL